MLDLTKHSMQSGRLVEFAHVNNGRRKLDYELFECQEVSIFKIQYQEAGAADLTVSSKIFSILLLHEGILNHSSTNLGFDKLAVG